MCDVTTLQAELEKREQSLEALQERVTALKERAKLQETPLQMQVIEMLKDSTPACLVIETPNNNVN